MLRYDCSEAPLNLGTGQEVTIKELAELVAEAAEYRGRIVWDAHRPDGQLRKRLDLTRMHATLGAFRPTPLAEGIRKTVAFYREHYGSPSESVPGGARPARGRAWTRCVPSPRRLLAFPRSGETRERDMRPS